MQSMGGERVSRSPSLGNGQTRLAPQEQGDAGQKRAQRNKKGTRRISARIYASRFYAVGSTEAIRMGDPCSSPTSSEYAVGMIVPFWRRVTTRGPRGGRGRGVRPDIVLATLRFDESKAATETRPRAPRSTSANPGPHIGAVEKHNLGARFERDFVPFGSRCFSRMTLPRADYHFLSLYYVRVQEQYERLAVGSRSRETWEQCACR